VINMTMLRCWCVRHSARCVGKRCVGVGVEVRLHDRAYLARNLRDALKYASRAPQLPRLVERVR
jgi:hypothetical protein